MGQPNRALPLELHVSDPNFLPRMRLWTFDATWEMKESVVATRKTIESSRDLMVEADRLLARDGL